MSNAVAAAWMEDINDQRVILRAVDGDTDTLLPGTVSQDFTTEPDQLDVAAGTTEFALVWSAQDFTGPDVFMRRFDEVGQPLFVTFSATGRTAADPGRPNVVRTPDGYAVFWIERAVDPPTLQFRRFVCAR